MFTHINILNSKMFEYLMQLEVVICIVLAGSAFHYVYRRFIKFKLLACIMKIIHLNVAKIKQNIFEEAIAQISSIKGTQRVEVLGIFID